MHRLAGSFFDWSTLPASAPGPHSLWEFLLTTILSDGATKLAGAMMYTAFGSILSQVILRSGLVSQLISFAAEYAGESKYLLAGIMVLVVAFCFTSVTGLGAVIMIGSLVMPILVGAGISSSFAVCLMLMAIAWGGIFNPAVFGFYVDTLHISPDDMRSFVIAYGTMFGIATMAFFFVQGWRERHSFNWSAPAPAPAAPGKRLPFYAFITPILPIVLILLKMPIIPAFIVGMLWGVLTTNFKNCISELTASILEGVKDISPVFGLFMGIGMALNAMMAEPTKAVLAPLLESVVPSTALPFVIFFSLLAPLALYRGPLNFYGLGAGIAGLLSGAQLLPNVAIMAAFFSVGQIQGVCDPTNTSNVWLGQLSKVSTGHMLKKTIPYVWIFCCVALIWAVYYKGVL